MSSDTRIVYGAHCMWWDSIDKVASVDGTPNGLPCCPHCGSVLFEMPDEASWWRRIDETERNANLPGYRELIEWSRGRCFRSFEDASRAHAAFKASQN